MRELELRPHVVGRANGELRVAVEVIDPVSGALVESDTVNLRSRTSRRRLASEIADKMEGISIDQIDSQLLQLTSAAEAAFVAPAASTDKAKQLFPTVEPWPDEVSGRDLLNDVERFVGTYIVLRDDARLALAAWAIAAWCIDCWDRFPHLAICSPEKRCGKTRLLSILGYVLPRALSAANISTAALYRAADQYRPSLLFDEAQWLKRRNSESAEVARELLCAGTERSARVLRIGGPDSNELQTFDVYGPKVLALIGTLDHVLGDRCLVVSIERKRPSDQVRRLLSRQVELDTEPLRQKLARWSQDHEQRLTHMYEQLSPFELGNDRAAEMVLSLQTVVTLADPDRIDELEAAVRGLVGTDEPPADGVAVELLSAIGEIFEQCSTNFVSTETLLEKLIERSEEPWATWKRGHPITARALAVLLKPFGIRPDHSHDRKARGYYRDKFRTVWDRYLPGGCPDALSQSVQPVQPVQEQHQHDVTKDELLWPDKF